MSKKKDGKMKNYFVLDLAKPRAGFVVDRDTYGVLTLLCFYFF